jgi:hypothetical protein
MALLTIVSFVLQCSCLIHNRHSSLKMSAGVIVRRVWSISSSFRGDERRQKSMRYQSLHLIILTVGSFAVMKYTKAYTPISNTDNRLQPIVGVYFAFERNTWPDRGAGNWYILYDNTSEEIALLWFALALGTQRDIRNVWLHLVFCGSRLSKSSPTQVDKLEVKEAVVEQA